MGSLVACGDDDEGGGDSGQGGGNNTALVGIWEQVHMEASDEDGVVDEDTQGAYVVFNDGGKGYMYSYETGREEIKWATKDKNVLLITDEYETIKTTYTLSEGNNKLVIHAKYVENGVPCYTISTWERRDHIEEGGGDEVAPPEPGGGDDNGAISGVWDCTRKAGYNSSTTWGYSVTSGSTYLVLEEDGTGYIAERRYDYEKETFIYQVKGDQLLVWNEGDTSADVGKYKLAEDGELLQVMHNEGDEYEIISYRRSSKDQLPEGLHSVRRTRSFLIA